MSKRLVLDTQVLKWMLEGNPKLNENAKAALSRDDVELLLPSLCLLEFYSIIDRQRTSITREQLKRLRASEPRLRVVSLTPKIAERAGSIPSVTNIHDRVIVATALADRRGSTRLVTADIEIHQSRVVDVLWAGDAKYA
jgi:PIN domain nuclease of toxin-antitoxin system